MIRPLAHRVTFSSMEDEQLLRYSRQIMLPGIDIEGQQKLLDSRVVVVGLGGLGSPVSMYLAAAGVDTLILIDDDVVDLSNLQRQIVHGSENIGVNKAQSASQRLASLNPQIKAECHTTRLAGAGLESLVADADIVVDCTDSFRSRFDINEACVATQRPLVSAAAIRMEGQVMVFRADQPGSPCYRCVYPDEGELGERCADTGVLGPVVGMIGCVQAVETVKVLLNIGESLDGRMLLVDARVMQWRELGLRKSNNCPVCATS